jgi:hypothetical protein
MSVGAIACLFAIVEYYITTTLFTISTFKKLRHSFFSNFVGLNAFVLPKFRKVLKI